MSYVVETVDLRAYYMLRRGSVKAVDGVNLRIREREIVGVVGESGCGKSTLSRALVLDFVPPLRLVGGKIIIDGEDITRTPISEARKRIAGTKISLIPQSAMNAIIPVARVRDYIVDVVKEKTGMPKERILDMARKRFEEIGLPPVALDMYPFELSGGMRQRVLIALATLLNPSLLIADEPTSALDVSTQKMVLTTLYNVFKMGLTKSIMFITHDIATVRQIATRIVVMYAGKIVEDGPTEDLIHNPFHPYSKALMYSILTPEPEIRKRVEQVGGISGEPPSLINPPPGCRFHPRCPYAMDVCRREEPPMIEVEKGRFVACWLYAKK